MQYSRLAPTPISYIGWGSLNQLELELKNMSPKRILVVTDPGLLTIGLADQMLAMLETCNYQYYIYSDLIPEPLLETAEKLVGHVKSYPYDLVIGFGGGSTLDMAKIAAVMIAQRGKVSDYLNLTGTETISHKGVPKIMIPTTAGTGSEVTNIAVVSLGETKDVISHDYLLPEIAIVDAALTISLPPRVTAATGMDALTHAIESYVSVNSNPVTDALALQAIRLIGGSIKKAVMTGTDVQARTDMAYGSFIAGLAFINAGVAGVHALAYPLGGQFHIPHGESNAVLLPYVMAYISKSCSKKMVAILNALGEDTRAISEEEAIRLCIEKLSSLVKELGLPSTLRMFNIPESALMNLTEDGVKQKRLLSRSPKPLSREDIFKIYQSSFTGTIQGTADLQKLQTT